MKKINFGTFSFISAMLAVLTVALIYSGVQAIIFVSLGSVIALFSLVVGIIGMNRVSTNKILGLVGIILSSLVLLYFVFGLYVLSGIH